MIHAGNITKIILVILDGLIGLDSDCLAGDGVSNLTTKVPDGGQCPEALNYTAQYCQCYNSTMTTTHGTIKAAGNSSKSFANTEDLEDLEHAVLLVKEVLNTPAKILANIKNCTSSSNTCLSVYEEKKNRNKHYTDAYHKVHALLYLARTSQNIVYYYMPPLITVVFLCGMIGNVTLLYIFYKHPDTRSGPKILLVSLAVSDILLLLFNFFAKYYLRIFSFALGEAACGIFTFLVVAPARASVLSIMVLSITRYIAVTAMPGDRSHKLLDHMPLAVSLVWVIASLQALVHSIEAYIIRYDFSDKTHCENRISMAAGIVMINITCFIPFTIIGVFTLATYRRLRGGGAKKTSPKTELDVAKERNAKILPALALLFTITYPPLYIFWMIAKLNNFALSSTVVWFYFLVQFLININSALNPIVLYFSSGMFREYFDKYLHIGCKKKQEEDQNKPESISSQTLTTPLNNATLIMYEKVTTPE